MKLTRLPLQLAPLVFVTVWPLMAQDNQDQLRLSDVAPRSLAPQAVVTVSSNYKLTPGDLIYVKVFQEDDLSSSIRVGEDGTIPFPLIGSVKLGGLTIAQATKAIYTPLDARFLVNPQITVTVLSFTDRHVTVLGQVAHAGDYNLKEQSSIDFLEAIGMAGGFTRIANTKGVTVRRVENGQAKIIRLNADKIATDSGTANFQILPGDIITVQERLF